MTTQRNGVDWRLFALVFALTAAAYVARAVLTQGSVPLFNDTDDAMRLVEIRDFLGGQGWYDLIQHRLNTPFGAEMHWSRLIDAPIAGLMLLLHPLAGDLTESVAAYVWPLLLLGVLMQLSAGISVRLAGPEAALPGLVLPAFSLISMVEFAPGRIDHHSVQILLALTMLLCLIEAIERSRMAFAAGLATACAIAIGAESLPTAVAGALAAGLIWVIDGRHAALLRNFGASFAFGTLALLVLALPPERWFKPYCDAISVVYAAAAVGTGLFFVLLSLLPLARRVPTQRLAAGGFAGVAVVALLYQVFPTCFHGAYSNLDPWLITHWIDRIDEAKPLWVAFFSNPSYVAAVGLPPLLAVLVTLYHLFHPNTAWRSRWVAYAVVLLLAIAVMLLQVRGARLATTLAAPAGAALIVAARASYLAQKGVFPVMGLVAGWVGFAGLALALMANSVLTLLPGATSAPDNTPQSAQKASCLMPAAFVPLAGLPKARIMAPIDLGSHLLAFTPHEVVGAPYHRDVAGLHDSFDFFNAPIAEARAILVSRGISLVVICPSMPELKGLPDADAGAFVHLYAQHTLPDWLKLVSVPGATLEIYTVKPL
ncbi:hypothetical protein [Devosia sp.]|uniref:hypothetical protein n=1 Tax=Devosia sp. TaxID=1871048 RepID=UPI003BAC59BB